jgi:uncharacterized protein with HEPN domain
MSELLRSVYENVLGHIEICQARLEKIHSASDFVHTAEGELLLDAVSMRLQAVGENVKRVLKLYPAIKQAHPSVDWESIVRFRDLISHHYEKLDYEVIFDIGKYQLPVLKTSIAAELAKLS